MPPYEIFPFHLVHHAIELLPSTGKSRIEVIHLLEQPFIRFFRYRLLDEFEQDVVFLEDVIAQNSRQPAPVVGKIGVLSGAERIFQAFDQGAFLFMLEHHVRQGSVRPAKVAAPEGGEKYGFLFTLMMIVGKTAEELEKCLHVLRRGHLQILGLIGHCLQYINRPKNQPVFLNQVICTT
jgi:hypothetical protein